MEQIQTVRVVAVHEAGGERVVSPREALELLAELYGTTVATLWDYVRAEPEVCLDAEGFEFRFQRLH